MARYAFDRAAAMIHELAGGEVLQGLIDIHPVKSDPPRIALRHERIAAVLGVPVDDQTVQRIFTRLDLHPESTPDGWITTVPSFRVDLSNEQDLLEEIARHHGFDKFPGTLPPSRSAGTALPYEAETRQVRQLLSSFGYSEIYNYSFSDDGLERRFYPDIAPVKLRNPMSEEAAILRTSLVPGMLRTLQWNLNRNIRNVQLYELSNVYSASGERRTLILGATGSLHAGSVHEKEHEFSFYDMKGDVELLLQTFNVSVEARPDNIPKYYHPGRFARVGHLAMFGELHPEYAAPFKVRSRIYLAEIDVDLLIAGRMRKSVQQIPKFPPIKRDFSLLLDKGTQYAAVQKTIAHAGISELIRVEPFDKMDSGSFPETKYSLSISVVYQSAERTLTDTEVETFDRTILRILEERLGAQLRK
jgi:phenylalanyl-tRNA synthetase beta chain